MVLYDATHGKNTEACHSKGQKSWALGLDMSHYYQTGLLLCQSSLAIPHCFLFSTIVTHVRVNRCYLSVLWTCDLVRSISVLFYRDLVYQDTSSHWQQQDDGHQCHQCVTDTWDTGVMHQKLKDVSTKGGVKSEDFQKLQCKMTPNDPTNFEMIS